MDIDPQSLVKLHTQGLVWREVGEDIIVLDTKSSDYLTINKTGAMLWPLLIEGSTLSALSEALKQTFEVDEATAGADASAFLSSLEERGLLERPSPT